jgi:hypothetical protein
VRTGVVLAYGTIMRIDKERKLFVGLRIDNKMREQLFQCPPRDKVYFDGSDPAYLQILRSMEDSYIGKMVDAGTAASAIEDLKRNILSILNRVSQGRHRDEALKIFAVDAGEAPPEELGQRKGEPGFEAAVDAEDDFV